MPKPRTCNQSVALLIRKFTLPAVQAAVEMAAELQKPAPSPKKKSTRTTRAEQEGLTKSKTMTASGELPERFDR